MLHMDEQAQESKTEPVGAKVTPSDLADIRRVRDHTNTPVAVLMYEHSLKSLIAWGRRLRSAS